MYHSRFDFMRIEQYAYHIKEMWWLAKVQKKRSEKGTLPRYSIYSYCSQVKY